MIFTKQVELSLACTTHDSSFHGYSTGTGDEQNDTGTCFKKDGEFSGLFLQVSAFSNNLT